MIKTTIKLIDYCTPVLNSINNCVKQLDIAVRDFDVANNAAFGGGSEKVYNDNIASIPKTVDDIDKTVSNVVESTNKLGVVAGDVSKRFNSVDSSIRSVEGSIGGLIKKAAIGLGAYFSVSNFIKAADDMVGINARISNAFDMSGDALDDYMNRVMVSSNNARANYNLMADSISKLGMQAKNAFGDPDELLRFSEILNKTFAISGTDSMGIQSTMYNLTQALASGVLRGQDLNAVMSNAPMILEKVADYLDTDISMIRELAAAGQLSSDVIKYAMLSAGDEIDAMFNNMPVTFSQMVNRVVNILSGAFSGAFVSWNELLNSEEFQVVLGYVQAGLNFIGSVLSYVIDYVRDLMPIIVAVGEAVWPVVAAFTAWKVAAIALNVALNANPIVLLLTIVLSIIVMLIKYWDGFSEHVLSFINVIKMVIGTVVSAVASLVLGIIQLVLHAIQGMVNIAIKGVNKLIGLANKIPGVNIGTIGEVTFASDFDATAQKWRAGIVDTLMSPISVKRNENVVNNINTNNAAGGYGGFDVPNYSDKLNSIGSGVSGINDKLSNGVEVRNEDIKNLADLMFNRAVRNVTLGNVEIKVDNSFGDIHENADVDEIAARICDEISLSINSAAIGV